MVFYVEVSEWPKTIAFPLWYEAEGKEYLATLSTKQPLTVAALKKYIHAEIMKREGDVPDTHMGICKCTSAARAAIRCSL